MVSNSAVSVAPVLLPNSNAASKLTTGIGSDETFIEVLTKTQDVNKVTLTADQKKSDVVFGHFGVDYAKHGHPYRINYYDDNGQQLTSSGFSATSILGLADKFDIPLTDLEGLGARLDELNIGYRPYQLYPDTGSDHGIDFADLIAGGLGTAYDWREDDNVAQKGQYAIDGLKKKQELAQRLGLVVNPMVTKINTNNDSLLDIAKADVAGRLQEVEQKAIVPQELSADELGKTIDNFKQEVEKLLVGVSDNSIGTKKDFATLLDRYFGDLLCS